MPHSQTPCVCKSRSAISQPNYTCLLKSYRSFMFSCMCVWSIKYRHQTLQIYVYCNTRNNGRNFRNLCGVSRKLKQITKQHSTSEIKHNQFTSWESKQGRKSFKLNIMVFSACLNETNKLFRFQYVSTTYQFYSNGSYCLKPFNKFKLKVISCLIRGILVCR